MAETRNAIIRIDATKRRGEPYNYKRIGWELERTAMGDGFYGNALRVAKDILGVSSEDRAVLDRYATGTQQGTDHIALQNIARNIYMTPQPVETRNDGFDKWLESPYTKVLEKSIKEDYVPQPVAPTQEPSDAHFVAEALRTANWAGCPIGNKAIIQSAIALLARYGSTQPSVPEGWKLVPVEPTRKMESAAEDYWNSKRFEAFSSGPRTWEGIYATMLAAAPKFGEEE